MDQIFDVIIIGSGPAGYTAGIYASRAKLRTLIVTGDEMGGQLMYTGELENFPGFSKGVSGPMFMNEMKMQAERFGAEVVFGKVNKVEFENRPFKIFVGEKEFVGKSVIIATGAKAIRLNLEKEDAFFGKGISVCAVCDAPFYQDKIAYVVGGGDSACEDALALSKFAKKVFMVVRRDELRASKIMQERVIAKKDKIEILWNSNVMSLVGNEKLEGLVIKNNKSDQSEEVEADGLFYAIGHRPSSEIFKNNIKTTDNGYIITSLANRENSNEYQEKLKTMTNIDGVFACGDVTDFGYKQAVIAAGEGAMAGLDCESWLEEN